MGDTQVFMRALRAMALRRMRHTDGLAAEVATLEVERDRQRAALRAARCPNRTCRDGVIHHGMEDPEPCQWCAERDELVGPEGATP